jgi:hypothetical protein
MDEGALFFRYGIESHRYCCLSHTKGCAEQLSAKPITILFAAVLKRSLLCIEIRGRSPKRKIRKGVIFSRKCDKLIVQSKFVWR